jgi:hypothetical protein
MVWAHFAASAVREALPKNGITSTANRLMMEMVTRHSTKVNAPAQVLHGRTNPGILPKGDTSSGGKNEE